MSTTLETLEIQFRAETGELQKQLSALTVQLALTDIAARQVENSFAAMGGRMAQLAGAGVDQLRSGLGVLVPEMNVFGLQSGAALAAGFASGVGSGTAAVSAAGRRLVNAADLSGGAAVARSLGRSTGSGYAKGLLDALPSVKSAARSLANAAQSIIRSALKIHSPSKVTRELGAFAGEGFSLGVKDELKAVRAQAAELAGAAAGAFSGMEVETVYAGAALNQGIAAQAQTETGLRGEAMTQAVQAAVRAAMDSLEITVPLNVDGMKLGEASIRGINAVTKRTGRLQLNI